MKRMDIEKTVPSEMCRSKTVFRRVVLSNVKRLIFSVSMIMTGSS